MKNIATAFLFAALVGLPFVLYFWRM